MHLSATSHERGPIVNNKPTYLSKDGLEKLRAELEEMTNVRRPEIADRIHDAKEHGDLTRCAWLLPPLVRVRRTTVDRHVSLH